MQGEALRDEITRDGEWCFAAKGDIRIVKMKSYGCESDWMCLLRVAWSGCGVNGSDMQRREDHRMVHARSADGEPIDREASGEGFYGQRSVFEAALYSSRDLCGRGESVAEEAQRGEAKGCRDILHLQFEAGTGVLDVGNSSCQ